MFQNLKIMGAFIIYISIFTITDFILETILFKYILINVLSSNIATIFIYAHFRAMSQREYSYIDFYSIHIRASQDGRIKVFFRRGNPVSPRSALSFIRI